MRAVVVVTSSEAKKLIARGIVRASIFKTALEKGTLAIHPSSTTTFIFNELTGKQPEGCWVSGVIVPYGTCLSFESVRNITSRPAGYSHDSYLNTWVFRKGTLQAKIPLGDLLKSMGPKDVYIKAPNLMDCHGQVGVLVQNANAGTIGRVIKAQLKNGFSIVAPVTSEKMIRGTLINAGRAAGVTRISAGMGLPVSVIPLKRAISFTEIEAFKFLAGVKAVQIAGGGLAGAEGAGTFALQGEARQISQALRAVEEVKGARLPKLNLPDCGICPKSGCLLQGKKPPWRME